MKQANPIWGAPRLHGELLKLGIKISERTISRLLPKQQKPPYQNWRVFLANHVGDLVSIDFFTVPTIDFRILFVFLVVARKKLLAMRTTSDAQCRPLRIIVDR